MFHKIKKFFTPNYILEEREREEFLRKQDIIREKEQEELRERCFQWAKKHIKRWGVWKYRYVCLVENPYRNCDDESTLYKEVYTNGNMDIPDGMVCYFHISELFPWKPDEEYYRDLEEGEG